MKFYVYCIFILIVFFTFIPCLAYVPGFLSDTPTAVLPSDDKTQNLISVYDVNKKETVALPLEEYITGVVAAEMPAAFMPEALKAQAVAARTYALSKTDNAAHTDMSASVCTDSAHCCAYISENEYTGGAQNYEKIRQATLDTAGIIMCYNDEPITAAFHSMSAGKTENAADVWGSDVPYLVSVDSPLDTKEEKFVSSVTLPFVSFAEKIKALNGSANIISFSDIGTPIYTDAGYVKSINIGGVDFSGQDIRNIFGLRSACFYITGDVENITFTVHGYGHGVGMSQYGANNLAKEGSDFITILNTYYSGVELVKIN